MPGKEWAIDEPCVRTVCHIWTIFPFHHFPGCGLHVDFMNKGQFWFQMETMLWCPSVLFMAGFAIAIAIPMVFPEVGFESNEHLGNILPLKISFFFFHHCFENNKSTPSYCVSIWLLPLQDLSLSWKHFLRILVWDVIMDQFIVMSNWGNKGKKEPKCWICLF